ncbi:hypothetical protein [Kingella potus]|uniref:hypothetical protein n=1 Tax=Kingella potus TaxID=265175 RepID=UPI001FD620CD|nr:hypothetical protein [Kingella potus]UOP01031.1 hypothetical protein LVJ84_01195 [Kingella potus]
MPPQGDARVRRSAKPSRLRGGDDVSEKRRQNFGRTESVFSDGICVLYLRHTK